MQGAETPARIQTSEIRINHKTTPYPKSGLYFKLAFDDPWQPRDGER
jgi:hypothetical protein